MQDTQDTCPDLINSLLNSLAYFHSTRSINLKETPISWVLLTGDYAYKIKKPVKFSFLDFATLERRRFFARKNLG